MKSNTNNLDVRLIVRSSDYNSGPDPATCTLRVSPALGSTVSGGDGGGGGDSGGEGDSIGG